MAAPPVDPSGPRRSSLPGLRWATVVSTVLPLLSRSSLCPTTVLGPGVSSTSPSSVGSLTHASCGLDSG
eukprot:11393410-Alexandrium_andersonii.AAC.1